MTSHMRREIEEIPHAVRRFFATGDDHLAHCGRRLRQQDPRAVVTVARGSSDHAAAFLKYAIELQAGVPVASVGPSIATIYGRELRLAGCAALAISQSGQSPDIVAMTSSARAGGALTFAITNDPESPLAEAAELRLDLQAGLEQSVAATKTFVLSIVAGLALLAHWRDDRALLDALVGLPEVLERATACDWGSLLHGLDGRNSLFVLGRGPALAIASEAALKFKETCGIHAEAYSAAEVLHGPARIVERDYPVLALVARDAAEGSVLEVVERLHGQGAQTFTTSEQARTGTILSFARAGHPLTDALALAVAFYGFVEVLSRHRGFDPDRPPHLNKVTQTL